MSTIPAGPPWRYQLLGPLLAHLPAGHAAYVAGRQFFPHLITSPFHFFPHLITSPFHDGLGVAFAFAIAANVIAAVASLLTGRRMRAGAAPEPLGAELAAVAAEGGLGPSELVGPGQGAQGAPTSRRKSQENGQSPAVTKSGGTEPS